MSTLTVDLLPAMWMSANRPIKNHGHRQRVINMIHELTQDCARLQHLPRLSGRYMADWTIHYPKGVGWVHGDAANAMPTCKATLDALVPQWLEGDGPRFIARESYTRGDNLTDRGWHRIVLELIEVSQ